VDGAPFDVRELILPDVLTPSQHVDRHRPGRTPLQRLAYALIDLTLHDLHLFALVKHKPGLSPSRINRVLTEKRGRYFADALAWLKDDDAADQLFSFNGCCELLGIEPDAFRRRLLEILDDSRREAA